MLRLLSVLSLGLATVTPALAAGVRFDENALRYYASLGQKDRVAAEVLRLQKIDPSWHVPDDLYAAHPGHPDEGPLWTLYAHNRMDELDQAITQRRTAEPGWHPSQDLAAKIMARQLRVRVLDLATAEDWHAIVASFKESGIAWAKDDPEALWIIAEAYARENDCSEAYVVYRSILSGHADAAARRATIERAMALIPMVSVEKLIAMGQGDAGAKSEFEPIAIDITRARISAFLHDEPANDIGDDELKLFEDFVRDAKNPNEPGLVAWYGYKRRDYAKALDWFKLAVARGGDAMIAHGLAHTLRKLDRKREAEEVAYAWREPLVNNAILFIDLLEEDFTKEQPPFVEPERVQRYAQVTIATESGEGAQALAWYAYNTCQYPLALKWFEHAVAWLPKEATVYGYALALQRTHRAKEFRDIVNRYDGLFPKAVALAFDNGQRRPPPPCEANPKMPSAPPQIATTTGPGADWTGRTMADTLRPQAAAPAALRASQQAAGYGRARVPTPEMAGGEGGQVPLTKRTEFPIAMTPENPLRFSALRSLDTEAAGHVRAREAAGPLVARRVPGVGAMPYEKYGFKLLPGWDGTAEASSPTSAERSPPVGTLWALEQSLHDGGTLTSPLATGPDTLARRTLTKASNDGTRPDRRS